jgi:hypothetical protein
VIFRWASDDPRVWWLGLWVFFSANWIGQDYLSPQAVGFTLWLAILAALLTWFTPRPAVLAHGSRLAWLAALLDPRRLRERWRREGETLDSETAPGRRAALLLTIVVIYAAIVTGHQLTPFAIVLAVGALALFAGLETKRLPVIMVVLLAAWISYQTTSYLIGHLQDVAGPVGATSRNLTKNVSGRVSGSAQHEFIVHVRIAASVAIWLLAALGSLRRFRARRVDLALILVAITPFVLPILQPYGGEMMLRVFLFALPPVAFFIACLAFPTRQHGGGWGTIAAVGLLCCALLTLFQFTRYGNERMDQFTSGDAAAVNALYRAAPPGTTLVGGNLPWRARDYADYDYRAVAALPSWRGAAEPSPVALVRDIAQTSPPGGSYVIVTRSMQIEAEMLANRPHVLGGLIAALQAWAGARELYRSANGHIFYVRHEEAEEAPAGGGATEQPAISAAEKAQLARGAREAQARARRSAARRRAARRRAALQRAPRPAPVRRAPAPPPAATVRPPAQIPPPAPPPPPVVVRPRPVAPPPPPPARKPPVIFDDSG